MQQIEIEKAGEELIAPLLKWYDSHKRVLPWREKPEPYRVWISEIMLQQTRVEAVKPYFDRFLLMFPDVYVLAEASEDQLLKAWEGLGYYNRIRNIKRAAVMIRDKHEGRLPDDYEALLALPGIGPYTAGAVASIAYNRRLPAVDGNVLRVYTRLTGDDRDVLNAGVKKDLEHQVGLLIPAERPGDFNQALMELGAVICLPNGEPKCGECPWGAVCSAGNSGTWMDYPKKNKKKARKIEKKTVLVIREDSRILLRKRPERGLLAGLYEFPNLEGYINQDKVLNYIKEAGLSPIRIKPLQDSRHIFTHKEWHMKGYMIRVEDIQTVPKGFILAGIAEAEQKYPLPAAFHAYTSAMRIRTGNDKFAQK